MSTKFYSGSILKYRYFQVGFIWLISTLVYLNLNGIVTNLEAGKYIEEAKRFINSGSFSSPRFYFYAVTLFIIVFAIKLKIGMIGAFIIQALLNLIAYLLFYKALSKVFKGHFTPLLIILYLLIFNPYQSWVVFLYTESAFFSAILILLSTLILYKPNNLKVVALIGLALVFTIVSRPLGILFGVGVYSYFFYHATKRWKIILGACSFIMVLTGYFLINIVFNNITDWRITQAFEQESIICDLPSALPYKKLDLAATGSPVYQLWYYLSHNFSHFLHFAGVKIQYFFLMTRNYYSKGHNFFLLFNVIPLYILAIGSFFIKQQYFNKGFAAFMVCSVLLFTVAIIFQCDDYHSRFILSIYPLFVILAAKTAEHLLLHLFKNNK